MAEMLRPPVIGGMIEAALKAAHIALMRRRDGVQVTQKPDGSFVSSGDYQAQQIIESELKKISPGLARELGVDEIGFLMEESLDGARHDFAKRLKGAHWVVDPIDGTAGYKQKFGENPPKPWAVSIALEKDGKTIAAAVYEASASECTTTDFTSITPNAPQGKIFWAHRDIPGAHRLEDGFTVTPATPDTTYKQRTRTSDNLLTLEIPLPDLRTDYAAATDMVLTGNIKPEKSARPILDGFYQDGQTRNKASEAPYKKEFCSRAGFSEGSYDDCYSAVAGAMQAADGRANVYMAGRCFPWDASAARLILEKSGTEFAEYAITGNDEQRTLLIAGRDRATFAAMKNTIENMQDDKGQPIVEVPETRRGFFASVATALATVAGWFGFSKPEAPLPTAPVAPAAIIPPAPETMNALPETVEQLMKLSDEQKIMLAAATASGCDAVAYYAADGRGGFVADKVIQLYPPAHYKVARTQPSFASTLAAFNPHTHGNAAEVMGHSEYHIPVPLYTASGEPTSEVKGIIVLHAPQEGFSRLQESATSIKDDLHEPVDARLAKLRMAEHIIGEHQDLFGATGKAKAWERHNSIKAKLGYFRKLIADTHATFGEGNDQSAHISGVAKFMDISVEKILNKDPARPLVDKDQAELIHDLTELHDIGKTQMSSAFMKPWRHTSSQPAKEYFFEENHNHPLFTMLELLLYPTEAKLSASHHHGVFRYGSDELKHALGEDFNKFTILKDNLKPEEISPLAYLMRIADVAESMTGRGDKSLEEAVKELGDKVEMKDGVPVINPSSIHPDYLCLAIKNGVFDAYGRGGDPQALQAAGQQVLEKFGWVGEAGAQKEAVLVAAIANDPLLKSTTGRNPQLVR